MKNMKKALLLAMSLVMSASLFIACGDKGDKGNSQDSTPAAESSIETPAAEKYTITFVGGDTVEYEVGATVTYPKLKKDGKTFEGWFIVNEATGEETPAPEKMPANDITVTAKWTLITKTITIVKLDGSTVTYTFAVEGNDDAENPIIAVEDLNAFLEENKSSATESYYEVAYEGVPKNWAIKDYTITEVQKKIDDEDVTSTMMFLDRVNKYLLQPDGSIKQNKGNYWDGAANIVTIENQNAVTAGGNSEYAVKVSFDPSLLTEEQKTEATTAETSSWDTWDLTQMWVSYAIPVNALNLNLTNVSFDMKVDNMNAKVIVYGVKIAEDGAEYAYEVGKNFSLTGTATADGWATYTLNGADVKDACSGTRAADYFVFSLDNTQSGYDNTKPSVAYIDNVVFADASAAHTHEYGSTLVYNATQHWKECVCGAVDQATLSDHTLTKSHDDDYHWFTCSDGCGYQGEKEEHTGATYESVTEGTHMKSVDCCDRPFPTEECEGEWKTVGTIGVDIKDVKTCKHCGEELEVFYLANVDAEGKEIVTEVDLNIADLANDETETTFALAMMISEVIMQQYVSGFEGLYYKGELLYDEDGIQEHFMEMPATIFDNVLGEHILEFVIYSDPARTEKHTLTLKINVVNNA